MGRGGHRGMAWGLISLPAPPFSLHFRSAKGSSLPLPRPCTTLATMQGMKLLKQEQVLGVLFQR